MTAVILAILAILWTVVLVPPLLRARERSGPGIGSYTANLGVLRHGVRRSLSPSPAQPIAPRPLHGLARPPATSVTRGVSERTARRRRDVLALLAMASMVSLAGAAVTAEVRLWALFAVALLALGAYLYAIFHFDRNAIERVDKVRYLRSPAAVGAPRHAAQPVAMRRRTGT